MRIWTIPTLALIAVLGVGGGVQLGRSAIAEIGPRYAEDGAGSKSYAELSPYRGPERAPLARAVADTDYGSGCIGCREYPEEYYPRHDVSFDEGAASARVPSEEPPIAYAVYQAGMEAEPDPELAEVERYSHYPVESEPTDEAPPPERAAAE